MSVSEQSHAHLWMSHAQDLVGVWQACTQSHQRLGGLHLPLNPLILQADGLQQVVMQTEPGVLQNSDRNHADWSRQYKCCSIRYSMLLQRSTAVGM